MKEGPVKLNTEGQSFPVFINQETKAVADPTILAEWGYPQVQGAELEAVAKQNGYSTATEDARVLMGQEKLTVFMVVDITRFVNPGKSEQEAAVEAAKGDEK